MNILSTPRWSSPNRALLWRMQAGVKAELFATGSLTRHIINRCPGAFSIEVLSQRNERPFLDEAKKLKTKTMANVRCVLLKCNEQPLVYARTIIPLSFLRRENLRLKMLGNHSLGAFLHNRRQVRRQQSEISYLTCDDVFYARIIKDHALKADRLWARRTVYQTGSNKILVNEVFLPAYWRLGL